MGWKVNFVAYTDTNEIKLIDVENGAMQNIGCKKVFFEFLSTLNCFL